MTNNILKTLKEYQKLYLEEREIMRKIQVLENETGKILGKYPVKINNYGFTVSANANVLKMDKPLFHEDLISLDELKEIEELTGAKLYKLSKFSYSFTW